VKGDAALFLICFAYHFLCLLNLVVLFVLLSAGDIVLGRWIFLTDLAIKYVSDTEMLTVNAYSAS